MTTINITHGIIENGNNGRGWLPYVEEDGHASCNTWASVGYSREDAAAMARDMASAKAARFVGDWDIRISDVGLLK